MTEPTDAQLQKACDVLAYKWSDYINRHLTVAAAVAMHNVAAYIAKQEASEPAIAPELVEALRDLSEMEVGQAIDTRPMASARTKARAILAELDASKPDPLDPLDVLKEVVLGVFGEGYASHVSMLRKGLEKRGLHITEIQS